LFIEKLTSSKKEKERRTSQTFNERTFFFNLLGYCRRNN
jgi:hypothetical protein